MGISGYRLKGENIYIDGDINRIVPRELPASGQVDGQFLIDIVDNKFKVWSAVLNRWIILGDAIDIRFDNNTNGFVSTNVQAAIEEIQSKFIFSGYDYIAPTMILTILQYQQSTLYQRVEIEGTLILNGKLVIFD